MYLASVDSQATVFCFFELLLIGLEQRKTMEVDIEVLSSEFPTHFEFENACKVEVE